MCGAQEVPRGAALGARRSSVDAGEVRVFAS